MANTTDTLELLRFELKFLEDGGYGRFPRTPWRARFIFEDSPTCPNLGDSARTIPCDQCLLMQFVPDAKKGERVPCRHIVLSDKGETIEHLYDFGTQPELEEAVKNWLRREIARLETQPSKANATVQIAR